MENPIINTLIKLFSRDLEKLKQELLLYKNEESIWSIQGDIKNSGGNLALHIIGNLKTYIGATLADSGYKRNRDFEFNGKNVGRNEMLTEIEETSKIVTKGLNTLSDNQLEDDFPVTIWKEKTKMAFTILHLHSHLNYHLGQVNYHRRLLDEVNSL